MRVRELCSETLANTWPRFEERLKEKYFDEDTEKMS